MHVTQMSCLLICISISRCTSGHRKQLSAEARNSEHKHRWLTHLPTRSALRTAILTPGRVALSDLRPSSNSNPHAPALRSPSSTSTSQTFPRSRDHFYCCMVCFQTVQLCIKPCYCFGSFLSFALSSVADEVWNVVFPTLFYPDESCGFTAHFHSTYNFRMTSSVCSQTVYFNVLFKLLMCNKWEHHICKHQSLALGAQWTIWGKILCYKLILKVHLHSH